MSEQSSSTFDLRLSNLPGDVHKAEIIRMLEPHARVLAINFQKWKGVRQQQCCFVKFPNDMEGLKAEQELAGVTVGNRGIQVSRAPVRRTGGRDQYFGRGGGASGRRPSPVPEPGNAYEKVEQMVITNVDDDCSFWAQSAASQKLDQMQHWLKSWCSQGSFVSCPDAGGIYAALFSEDDNWYRCQVQKIGQLKHKILYIDYGNTDLINSGALVQLPDTYRNNPPFAKHYDLAGVDIEASDQVSSKLKSLMGETITCYLYGRTGPRIPAAIVHGGSNVSQELIDSGFVKKVDIGWHSLLAVKHEMEAEMRVLGNQIKKERHIQASLKSQINLAVQEKFSLLGKKLCLLPRVRREVERHLDMSEHPLEKIYQLYANEKQAINPNEMEVLKEVRENVAAFHQAQDDIRNCKELSSLDGLISTRDKLRNDVVVSIQSFLYYVSSLSVEERHTKLQEAKDELVKFSGGWNRVVEPAPTLEDAKKEYNEWKVMCLSKFEALPKVNDNLMHQLQCQMNVFGDKIDKAMAGDEAEEAFDGGPFGQLFNKLTSSLDDEANASSECMKRKVQLTDSMEIVMQTFLTAILNEMKAIEELQNSTVPELTELHTQLSAWLDVRPDPSCALKMWQHIRSLRGLARQKEGFLEDLKESCGNDLEQVAMAEKEVAELLLSLHKAAEEQKDILKELHANDFPELSVCHPELKLAQFQETKGLFVAPELKLRYFLLEPYAKQGCFRRVYRTVYCGNPALLKTLWLESQEIDSRNSIKRMVAYSSVEHSKLVPILSILYDQVPLDISFLTPVYEDIGVSAWLEMDPPIYERCFVMRDWLHGLDALHSAGLVHASVSADTLMVVKVPVQTESADADGNADDDPDTVRVKGMVSEYDFSKSEGTRAALLPEFQCDATSYTAIAWHLDIFCLGLLAERIFSSLLCEDPQASDFVMKMVQKQPKARPTAAALMKHPYLNPIKKPVKEDTVEELTEESIELVEELPVEKGNEEEESEVSKKTKEETEDIEKGLTSLVKEPEAEAELEEYVDAKDQLETAADTTVCEESALAVNASEEPEVTEE